MKNIRVFLSENFQFLVVKFSVYLNRPVFIMENHLDNNLMEILAFVYYGSIVNNHPKNLKVCLWKQRIHKRTNMRDSVLLSLFTYSSVVCEAVYKPGLTVWIRSASDQKVHYLLLIQQF